MKKALLPFVIFFAVVASLIIAVEISKLASPQLSIGTNSENVPSKGNLDKPDPTIEPANTGSNVTQLAKLPLLFVFPTGMQKTDFNEVDHGGETGNRLTISSIEKSFYMSCGTFTNDWSAGIDLRFSFRGFKEVNGKYFALDSGITNKDGVPLDENSTTPISNKNGLHIILVDGKNEFEGPRIYGTPGDGYVGALINFPQGSKYSGMSCEVKKNNESEFIYILENMKWLRK